MDKFAVGDIYVAGIYERNLLSDIYFSKKNTTIIQNKIIKICKHLLSQVIGKIYKYEKISAKNILKQQQNNCFLSYLILRRRQKSAIPSTSRSTCTKLRQHFCHFLILLLAAAAFGRGSGFGKVVS